MEQLDIIALEKELKKERFKNHLTNKRFMIETSIAVASLTAGALVESSISRMLFCFGGGTRLFTIKVLHEKILLEEKQKVIDIISESETYKELEKEYEAYIKDLANLIKIFGFKSAKEILLYLQFVMETGLLNPKFDHKYKIFKYEKDYFPELHGARVITGRCVCRHMSSLYSDILNELNYSSANIHCVATSDDPVKMIQKRKAKLNHCVTGVVDNGEKIIYDPTHGLFLTIPTGIDNKAEESMHVTEYIAPQSVSKEKKYLILSPNIEAANIGRKAESQALNTTRLARITIGEYEYLRNRVENLFCANKRITDEFYFVHFNQMRKIDSLYQELMPFSDTPITKQIIRK